VNLLSLGEDVEWPDSEAGTEVRERLAGQAALGRLATLAEWLVAVRPPESDYSRVRAVVVGDEPNGLVVDTAAAVGADVRSVAADGDVSTGIGVADDVIDRGADLLVVALPGVQSDAAVAVSVLTNTEPVKVLSRGAAATDPEAWMELAVTVRDARRRCMPSRTDADGLLAELGSPRLAVAAGLVLRAAARRTPVLIDGPTASAAALVAYEAQPRAVRWWAAADLGPDPLHTLALTRLGQEAILGLGTGLGDGLAGLLAVPVIRAAARFGDQAAKR
jgi:nicotinate-nucleotide--dimethylbenzimidazole phosphoribosyltransferase